MGNRICNKSISLIILLILCIFLLNCNSSNGRHGNVADHSISKETVLRSIPANYIEAAKNNLHIMYCGTSHSSQVVDGMRGLMEYKTGDDSLYAVTFNGTPVAGALDIDYRPTSPVNVYEDAQDLSNDGGDGHTLYFDRTVEYLDHADHADVNVVMWSWCSIVGHDVKIYLNNFSELIGMYKAGGSKGRTSENEVTFIFMTGYAYEDDSDTPEPPYIMSPYQNHKRIVDYCRENGHYCLDYWSQDTHHYETGSYDPTVDANDNNLHYEYVNNHTQGVHWFQCRDWQSGNVGYPAHCDGGSYPQHLTGNLRAYAAWWIFAKIAGF